MGPILYTIGEKGGIEFEILVDGCIICLAKIFTVVSNEVVSIKVNEDFQ